MCVADEVQVGFGRIGEHFWGFELDGVVPDIVTLGKPIGNGHPLGAVVTTPEIAASFVTGMEYFNTFGGNPVSAEIGLAVLDVIADERLQAHALAMGARLIDGLRGARLSSTCAGAGCSSASSSTSRERAARVKEGLKARGVLISTDGPNDDVLKIKPPLVISAARLRPLPGGAVRRALVTGAGSADGIGFATARLLAARGFEVDDHLDDRAHPRAGRGARRARRRRRPHVVGGRASGWSRRPGRSTCWSTTRGWSRRASPRPTGCSPS